MGAHGDGKAWQQWRLPAVQQELLTSGQTMLVLSSFSPFFLCIQSGALARGMGGSHWEQVFLSQLILSGDALCWNKP